MQTHVPCRKMRASLDRYFDRSAEAMWLFDPQSGLLVDCNAAAAALLRARDKSQLINRRPELDGHAVVQALQNEPALAAIPFIFLTAKGEKSDQRSGMNLGADDYLTKPVNKADLLNAVQSRLRRADQQGTREFKPDFPHPRRWSLWALGHARPRCCSGSRRAKRTRRLPRSLASANLR